MYDGVPPEAAGNPPTCIESEEHETIVLSIPASAIGRGLTIIVAVPCILLTHPLAVVAFTV